MQGLDDARVIRDFYGIKARATDLKKKDFFGLSDPYFVIYVPNPVFGAFHNSAKKAAAGDYYFGAAEVGYDLVQSCMTAVETAAEGISLAVDAASTAGLAVLPIVIAKVVDAGRKVHPQRPGFIEIFSSNYIKRTLNPIWEEYFIQFQDVYYESPDAIFFVEIWDWDRVGRSDYLGGCIVNAKDLFGCDKELEYTLHNKLGTPTPSKFYIQARVATEAEATSEQSDCAGSTATSESPSAPLTESSKKLSELRPLFMVRAKYDYSDVDTRYLTFKKDQVITIYNTNSTWWLGKVNGQQGYVPPNFVQQM